MNTPGRKVRTVRAWLGISQQELASLTQIKRTYISQFENGETMLTPEDLKSIKRTLGIKNLDDPIENILAKLEPINLSLAA